MSQLKNNLYGESIFSVDQILNNKECENIIQLCNDKGWKKSSPSGGGHGRTGKEDARTNSFCVFYDNKLAENIWNKISPFLNKDLSYLGNNVYFNSNTKGSEWKPSFIYDKIRIYKYEPKESFPEHLDYKVKRNIKKGDEEVVQQSFLSVLIYLNDDFKGGETGYWPDHNGIHCRFLRNVEKQNCKKDHQVLIKPKTGLCVIQDQNILHEGLPTTKGTKYLLRTDIIHERDVKRNSKIINEKDYTGDWERLFETSCKNYAD
tara:strand:- start:138 stop:920 length:783 start_codon:yes stop_codon:yes gene_type:complete